MIRQAPLLATYAAIISIMGGSIWMANAALDLPVVHKSVKDDGACVRVLSLDGTANCENMPKKYVIEWVE